MKKIFIATLLFLFSLNSVSSEFKLRSFSCCESRHNSVQLYVLPDNDTRLGKMASFEEIMSLLDLGTTDNELYIRILPGLSEEAKKEILNFYQANFPKELVIAKHSDGHLNDPAILPLNKVFSVSLKTTAYYKELESVIKKIGFGGCEVSYEKFEFEDGSPWVAELDLKCHRNF